MTDFAFRPTLNDVLASHHFLRDRVRRTPNEFCPALSEIAEAPVFVKWENQQLRGSFKIRGALYRMNLLTPEERERGVVTCSSGNHGQGVLLAAAELEIPSLVILPDNTPESKKKKIASLTGKWGQYKIVPGNYDDAERAADLCAKERGLTRIASFADPWVLSAQGSAGIELMMDEPDTEVVLVPAGGGGLLNGIALAAKGLNPRCRVFGVQSVASNPWVVSWESGIVQEVEYLDTLADGLAGTFPQIMLDLAKHCVSGVFDVTEEELGRAIVFAHDELHQFVEGAGAVGIAALLTGKFRPEGRKTCVVVSGGNIDPAVLNSLLKRWGA